VQNDVLRFLEQETRSTLFSGLLEFDGTVILTSVLLSWLWPLLFNRKAQKPELVTESSPCDGWCLMDKSSTTNS
jgi:hypothetical protein